MQPLVVIGTGLAGYNLLKEFRKLNTEKEVVMITADDGTNYSKPMLSTGFTKQKTADELAMHSAQEMALQHNATVHTFSDVKSIDRAQKRISVGKEGETFIIQYSDLVLAQGAEVFEPLVSGDGQRLIYTVNDLLDYGRFREALGGKKKVLIVGGGLIGCEFANDLANGGFQVELVEPVGRVLPSFLPEAGSQAVAAGLSELGVQFYFGPTVDVVDLHEEGVRATLSNGQQVDADLVLSAVGLRPRIALAQAAGLEVGRGVSVDRQLRSLSDEHIYALGDCAQVDGRVLLYVLPLMASARALAKTLAGAPTDVSYGVMPVTIKTPACPVVVSLPPLGADGEWHTEVAEGADTQSVFLDARGEALGYALTGATQIKQKMALNKTVPSIMV